MDAQLNEWTTRTGSIPPAAGGPPQVDAATMTRGWKSEVTAKVRAHRARGSRALRNQPALPGMEEALSPASIAARVAERYSRLPSYRQALEAQEAQAAAEMPVLAEEAVQELPVQTMLAAAAEETAPCQAELLRYSVSSDSLPVPRETPPEARADFPATCAEHGGELMGDPLETAVIEPTIPLPARFVAQPRELIAPRKGRPRLAEGPLREEMEMAAGDGRPPDRAIAGREESVANSPAGGAGVWAPEATPEANPAMPRYSAPVSARWLSIDLDTEASVRESRTVAKAKDAPVLHVASMEDRFFSGLIDIAFTLLAFLMFFLVFVISSTSLPHGRVALITAGVTLFAMWLIYQLLFFGFTDATPGMRYVKIALCTFDDENPGRGALRGRIAASLLSAVPLGLGFLWAVFDEDGLGWHDRITQTYQRSYRER